MNTVEDLTARILNKGTVHNGAYAWQFKDVDGDWEHSIYDAVYAWVASNVEFFATPITRSESLSRLDTHHVTAPFTNSGRQTVQFSPRDDVTVVHQRSWHISASLTASVTLSEKVGVQVGVASGEAGAEVSISGTLETGAGGADTYTDTYGWGVSVPVGPNESGQFVMDIVSKEFTAKVDLNIVAEIRPGVSDLIYHDEFQGDNTFEWSRLVNQDKLWVVPASVDAGMSVANPSRWEPLSIPVPELVLR